MKAFCPKCSREVEIPDNSAGSSVSCPACGAAFTPASGGPPKLGITPAAGGPPKLGITPAAGGPPKLGTAPAAGGPPKLNMSNPQGGSAPATGGPPKLNISAPQGGIASAAGGPPKLNIPAPGGGSAPAAGSPPKLNLTTPKSGVAPAAGSPPKLNLTTPKSGIAPAAGSPPKLNLTVPRASAGQTKAADNHGAATKTEEPGKTQSSGEAGKMPRIAVLAAIVIVVLVAAGAILYLALSDPSDPQKQLSEAEKSIKAGDTEKAVRLLEKSAKQGNRHAAALLGEMYLKGEGVPENISKAVELFTSADTDPLAHFRLGQLYAEGKGVDKDPAEAAKHYEAAVKGGHSEAEMEYARCYAEGLGVRKDERKAVPWRKKLADEGDPAAQLDMAKYYINGVYVDYSPAEAVRYLTLAAKQGNRTARYRLAEYTLRGIATEKNANEARNDLAGLYHEITGAPKDRKPDDSDLVVAAKCLMNGYGVRQPDPEQAVKLLAGPAKRKNPEAVMLLYVLAKDKETKEDLLKRAVALNIPEAKEITALQNAETDPAKAERLLKEAQEQGSVSAFSAAAMLHMEKEPEQAFRESQYACKRGDPLGSLICAKCLGTGRGTEKDLEQALKIYWDLASCPSPVQAQAHASLMKLFGKKENRDVLNRSLQNKLKNGTPEEKKEILKMQAGLYLSGIGVPKNTSKAVELLWKARAANELIRLLDEDIEVPKIVSLCLKENDIGDPELLYTLAKLLLSGEKGVTPDPAKGVSFLKKAAAANHPKAAYELGCFHAQEKAFDLAEPDKVPPGTNIGKSPAEAMKFFRQAAEAGHPEAQYRYARALLGAKNLPDGVTDKTAEAGIWLKQSARERYAPALFLYAMVCLDSGKAAGTDHSELLQMLRTAAEAGYSPAMFAMGDIAAAAERQKEADEWYKKAAAEKFVPALILLRKGKDHPDRIREAAAAGYLPAQAEEALALLKKERKEKSLRKSEACKKLEKLRELGCSAGLNELGVAAYGKNKKTALKIFNKAKAEGSACALFNLGVYTYREENLGGGNYQRVKDMFGELRTTHPEFKRIPEGLEQELDNRMRLESEFRQLNARHKELLRTHKLKSSPEARKDAERNPKELEKCEKEIVKMRNELDAVTASLKKKLDWIIASDYSDYLRKAPANLRYPWVPAPDLSPLKDAYE